VEKGGLSKIQTIEQIEIAQYYSFFFSSQVRKNPNKFENPNPLKAAENLLVY